MVEACSDMLHKIRPFVRLYKTAEEAFDEQAAAAPGRSRVLSPSMESVVDSGFDKRRTNSCVADKSVAITHDERFSLYRLWQYACCTRELPAMGESGLRTECGSRINTVYIEF